MHSVLAVELKSSKKKREKETVFVFNNAAASAGTLYVLIARFVARSHHHRTKRNECTVTHGYR